MPPTFNEFRHDEGCEALALVALTITRAQYRRRLGVALCPDCKQRGFIDIDEFDQAYTVLPSPPLAPPG